MSYPEVRTFIIDAFVSKSKDFEPFDIIAGVATAGIPHGVLLAERLGKPFVYVRDKAKQHGRQNQIEGKISGKESVLVIEDLISTGKSSLAAVETLRDAGCTVKGILSIFSYGMETAVTVFRNADCRFEALSDYETLIKEAAEHGYVSGNELELLAAWRKNPERWLEIPA